MIQFAIKIADCVIQVSTNHNAARWYCKDYLTEEAADFAVELTQEDIQKERENDRKEKQMEGIPMHDFSDDYMEYLALYRKIADRIIMFDTVLFHGSVVAVDGQAYLFTAKSGTGKSTHTRLWRKLFGERAIMVNDDKPLLKITDNGVLVCGTPWDGKHKLSTNCMLPLKAICILDRGEKNEIHPIEAAEALPMVLQQSHRPGNMLKYMDTVDKLMRQIRFFHLHCNMDPEAAKISYEAMK